MNFLSRIFIHAFFLLFHLNFLNDKCKLSIKDYLLLNYTFMCIILFLRIIILTFQRHQTRILSAGLGIAWNWDGLSCITGMTVLFTDQFCRENGGILAKIKTQIMINKGRFKSRNYAETLHIRCQLKYCQLVVAQY